MSEKNDCSIWRVGARPSDKFSAKERKIIGWQLCCKDQLDSSLDFSCFDARSADLHAFDGLVDERLNRLKVWEPSPLFMRVPV